VDSIVLDTDILIDYANGYAQWIESILERGNPQLVLPTVVIAEFFASQQLENPKEVFIAERTFSFFTKQDLTESIAKLVGTLLRRKSYTPGASIPDLIIAATAISLHAKLATRNRAHFRRIPDLSFFEKPTITK